MSINISEEYLDELLQAIEPIISPEGAEEQTEEISVMPETLLSEEPTEIIMEDVESEIGIDQLFLDESDVENVSESPSAETVMVDAEDPEGTAVISDLLSSLTDEEDEATDEFDMSEEDVESMLHSASDMAVQETDEAAYDKDVKELLKQFTEDEDLSDIQEILDKNDNGEALDDSMLDVPDVEVFHVEEDSEEDDENKAEKPANPIKKLFGGFTKLLKSKKEKKKKDSSDISDESEEVIEQEFSAEPIDEYEEVGDISIEDMLDADGEDLILDEDFSDIEQLLTGGTFAEVELSDEEQSLYDEADGTSKKKDEKKAQKKETLFSKLLNVLTEEIDDSESGKSGSTEGNIGTAEELSKEEKKKAKKDKKKSKKTGKNAPTKGDNEEDEAGKNKKDKKSQKPKKAKVKKEKKEKPRKVEEITKPEKKLPRKRVLSTLALCFSIMAAVLILQNEVMKADNRKEAKMAFDSGDYATCYANLNGIERDDDEEMLYQKSTIILSVQRKLDSYHNFLMMGNGVEAVNALLEGVLEYREKEALAVELGVHGQIQVIYQKFIDGLQGYGLSEADIEEILSYDSKVTYTKRLDSIVNGTPFISEDMIDYTDTSEPQPLQDILPQEEDFLPEDTTDITGAAPVVEEENYGDDYVEPQGQTTVVGSNPVNVFDAEQNVNGGQNVGSGSTNVSMELDGQSVIVGDF